MAENMERRDFIKSAGLVAGIAAASTLGQRSANAETAQPSGAKRMAYEIKPFSLDPKSVKGISEKILISHYENNYVGAVKRLNAIAVQLAELDFAKAPNFLINGLKREELVAMNSMILHEAYFDSLGGGGTTRGSLADAITRDFGSHRCYRDSRRQPDATKKIPTFDFCCHRSHSRFVLSSIR